MSRPHDRRGFLRGLVSLPLLGGGMTLIGSPTAAAVPITLPLMTRYVAWLAREHAEALVERDEVKHPDTPHSAAHRREWVHQPLFWFPDDPVAEVAVRASRPSSRAAAVLAAAGCDWRVVAR